MAALPGGHVRAEDLPLARRLAGFAFIVVGYFFYAWSWNTVDVLRPYIADALKLSREQAGFLYTAQAAGALIGAVINAQLADRYGRRNALVCVMVGYGVLLWAGAHVDNYVLMLLQRAGLGYFMGSMYPIAVGIYPGLFAQKSRGTLASILFAFYNIAVALQGEALKWIAPGEWRLLLYVGLAAVALAPVAFLVVPDDRRTVPWGGVTGTATTKLPVAELFRPEHRAKTALIVTMTGLNFFAYQSFYGWNTTYLKEVLGYGENAVGAVVSATFLGAAAGGLLWGPLADRLGRRFNALGFALGAVLIGLYLVVPMGLDLRRAVVFAATFAISSSMIWGPWIAEMFPTHLRSTAASMFNWGRIISMLAPPITAALSSAVGLPWTMALAGPVFLVAALAWLRLPETLRRGAAG